METSAADGSDRVPFGAHWMSATIGGLDGGVKIEEDGASMVGVG
jgi:hypothetical protein